MHIWTDIAAMHLHFMYLGLRLQTQTSIDEIGLYGNSTPHAKLWGIGLGT